MREFEVIENHPCPSTNRNTVIPLVVFILMIFAAAYTWAISKSKEKADEYNKKAEHAIENAYNIPQTTK